MGVILSVLGGIGSVLRFAIPWLGPRTGFWGGAALAVAISVAWFAIKIDRAAIARAENHFRTQISKINNDADKRVKEALNAGETLTPTPDNRDDLIRMCKADDNCRQ